MSSSNLFGAMGPGGGFVVGGACFETAVQDSDEPVRVLTQRGVVADAPAALLVVVGAGTGRPATS